MSIFNEVIYRDPENEAGSNLDYVRRSFYNLFKMMETSDSLITNERISNSFLFHSGLDATFLNTAAIYLQKSKNRLYESQKHLGDCAGNDRWCFQCKQRRN